MAIDRIALSAMGVCLVSAMAHAQYVQTPGGTTYGRIQIDGYLVNETYNTPGLTDLHGNASIDFQDSDAPTGVLLRAGTGTETITQNGTNTLSGTLAVNALDVVTLTNIGTIGSITIVDAATLYIAHEPKTESPVTSVTNYSLKVASGDVLIRGGLEVSGVQSTGTATAYASDLESGTSTNANINTGASTGNAVIGNTASLTTLGSALIEMSNLSTSITPQGYVCTDVATTTSPTSGPLLYGASSCTPSSRRWKENIVNLKPSLSEAMRLRPVSFVFNEDSSGESRQTGFIAEEVGAVDGRLVATDGDSRAKAIRYSAVESILIRALQEEQTQIRAQRAEIERLSRLLRSPNR